MAATSSKPWRQNCRAAKQGDPSLRDEEGDKVAVRALSKLYRSARATGVLNLASRGLKQLPSEVLALGEHMEEGEKFWEVAEMTKLDVSYNELCDLPAEIGDAVGPALRTLLVKQNRLSDLPASLFDLAGLQVLDLAGNHLTSLSPAIANLGALRELTLTGNKLSNLPDTIDHLEALESLHVGGNGLMQLPRSTGQLRRLNTLTAPDNKLQQLPVPLLALPHLRLLDLRRNHLCQHMDLRALTSLTYIDLRENRLTQLPTPPRPSVVSQLYLGLNQISGPDEKDLADYGPALSELDLQGNALVELPTKMGRLCGLKSLDVSNNDLKEVPPSLGYLPSLNRICLDGNPIRSIRRALLVGPISELKAYLRTRGPPAPGLEAAHTDAEDLQHDQLESSAPQALQSRLRDAAANSVLSLTGLDVSQPAMQSALYAACENLPEWSSRVRTLDAHSVGASTTAPSNSSGRGGGAWHKAVMALVERLHGLTALDLSDNRIGYLPAPLLDRPLPRLNLSRNQLNGPEAFPFATHTIAQAPLFRSLRELDMRQCGLRAVPACILLLRTLHTLLLTGNNLATLRVETQEGELLSWNAMEELNTLDVSNNHLTDLGDVYLAPALHSLNLENNDLQMLPLELGLCERLRSLQLAGNPQRLIRTDTIRKGTAAVLAHLRDRLRPDHPGLASPPPTSATSTTTKPSQNRSGASKGRTADVYTDTRRSRSLSSDDPHSCRHATACERQHSNDERSHVKQGDVGSSVGARHMSMLRRGGSVNGGNSSGGYTSSQVDTMRPGSMPCSDQQPHQQQHDSSGLSRISSMKATSQPPSDPLLEREIGRLERELEDVALTSAKRMALRRELGRKRALRLQQQHR